MVDEWKKNRKKRKRGNSKNLNIAEGHEKSEHPRSMKISVECISYESLNNLIHFS